MRCDMANLHGRTLSHYRLGGRIGVVVTLAALLSAMPSHVTRAQSRPFTPQVEEFVDIYLKHGGDVLTETWSAVWLP